MVLTLMHDHAGLPLFCNVYFELAAESRKYTIRSSDRHSLLHPAHGIDLNIRRLVTQSNVTYEFCNISVQQMLAFRWSSFNIQRDCSRHGLELTRTKHTAISRDTPRAPARLDFSTPICQIQRHSTGRLCRTSGRLLCMKARIEE